MKAQSRLAALTESWVNIAVGIGLSTALNLALLPLVRSWPLWQATALMVGAFTAMSFARSYSLRRIFERARTAGTPPDFLHVVQEIAAERLRQINGEGFGLAHDDGYIEGELAAGAAAYAYAASLDKPTRAHFNKSGLKPADVSSVLRLWPWSNSFFKPTHPRRDLVKAGAMIVAEIGRLDRLHKREAR